MLPLPLIAATTVLLAIVLSSINVTVTPLAAVPAVSAVTRIVELPASRPPAVMLL